MEDLIFPQRQEDIAEAEAAIHSISPLSGRVVSTVRSFAILGRPGCLAARLEDGSEWLIDGVIVRQFSAKEIEARQRTMDLWLS